MIRNEKGQSMVEMALILPLLLLLICGIFDMGRLMYTYMNLHLTTQETVRQGGLGATDNQMTNYARNNAHVQDSSNLVVTITPGDATRDSGEYVTVQLKYPLEFVTPIISQVIPSPIMVTTDSTIRVE